MKYQGQTVWITGASSGIGEALAHAFAAEGADLILSARRKEELLRVRESLPVNGQYDILPMDVSQGDTLQGKVSEALDIQGRIDILVNNAGISQRCSVEESDLAVHRQIMEVNFFGNIALAKYLLPHYLERGSGRYVIVSSVVGKLGPPFRSAYAASKHALHGWYDALRAETEDRGVKVHMICPGYIRTNISVNALKGKGEKHGVMDGGQQQGLSAEDCARQIMKAVDKNKNEVIIGKEKIFVWLRKFFPWFYYRTLRKMAKQRQY